MGKTFQALSLIAVLLSVAVYRRFPTFPAGLQITSQEKVQNLVGSQIFNLLLTLEGFGLIDDSAITFRQMSHSSFPDFSKDPSHSADVIVENKTISDVPVLIFRPHKDRELKKGALIYFHGGAFIMLSPSTHFLWTKMISLQADVIVISVDYRLAPEHPYPAAVEDCLKVTKAVVDNAEEYLVDPSRIMVGGESAGGNLAAIVAIELATSPKYRLKGQLLLSPVLLAGESLPSIRKYGFLLPLPAAMVIAKYSGQPFSHEILSYVEDGRFYISDSDKQRFGSYVNMANLKKDTKALLDDENSITANDGDKKPVLSSEPSNFVNKVLEKMRNLVLDERAWPLLTRDDEKLRRMCPTFLSIAEFDPLRDEELLYYERLRSLGVRVSFSYMPGIAHAGPMVAVITRQPIPESVQTKFIPDMIQFIRDRMISDNY